ncbi:TRIM2_3 [Mytilus coruscus]|uniref:TRIM2_3 n=1 Tax=Mytilus coruscus TaxID=42192 RepID=A0A6J7ZSY9_MYTCO|nr:TRIM2_3 [Mytilus coruscus]
MANSRQDLVVQLQQRYLECGICSELYDEQNRIPKLLPCLHTLCMTCLFGLNSGNKIKCPFCNKEHHIKREEIANLPKDNTRRDLTCFLQNNTEINCSVCNKTDLNIRICNSCDINMCVDCQRQHKKIFEEHCFGYYAAPRLSNDYTCKLTGHENGHMRYFCKETKCNIIICATCAITKHKGHNIADIERVYFNEKEFFSYLIERLRDKITTAELFKASIVPELNDITMNNRRLYNDIECTRRDIFALLTREYEELIKMRNEEVQNISNVENVLQAFIRNARDCCEFSEQLLQSSNQNTFFILEQATKERIFRYLNIKMDEMKEKCRQKNERLEADTGQFEDILYLVSLNKRYRRGLRKISTFPSFHSGMEIVQCVEQKTQSVSTWYKVTFLALLCTVLMATAYVFADEIPHLFLGSDIVPELHFIYNNSPTLFPCRSFDNKRVSSKPYSSGFICSDRRYKFKGIFGNTSFNNDQAYELDISVRIEGIKQRIHDERVIFEIGLSRKKIHDSYLYENSDNAWVVYGVNCGTDLCLQYNDRISPYIQRIKHDKDSGLLETRLVLRFEPKTKSLKVSSNLSTVTYTFTNVSAAEAALWPICGIYHNDSFVTMSINSSYPSFVTFDATTLFPGLFVSKDAKVFANWKKSVSGIHFHNPISSYIFSEPMISKSQEEVFYTVEIIIKENRFLPNNTMLFEVGTLGKHHFGTEFFINILIKYDFEQNSIGYFSEHMNGTFKLCDSNSISLPVFTITAIVSFHGATNSFRITLLCNNGGWAFYENFIEKYPTTFPQFYLRKTCIFCRPYIEAKIRRVNYRELLFLIGWRNSDIFVAIICIGLVLSVPVFVCIDRGWNRF